MRNAYDVDEDHDPECYTTAQKSDLIRTVINEDAHFFEFAVAMLLGYSSMTSHTENVVTSADETIRTVYFDDQFLTEMLLCYDQPLVLAFAAYALNPMVALVGRGNGIGNERYTKHWTEVRNKYNKYTILTTFIDLLLLFRLCHVCV